MLNTQRNHKPTIAILTNCTRDIYTWSKWCFQINKMYANKWGYIFIEKVHEFTRPDLKNKNTKQKYKFYL